MTRRNVRSHEYDRIIGPCFKSMATIPKRAQATCPGWIVPYTMVKQPIIPKTTWPCKRIRAAAKSREGPNLPRSSAVTSLNMLQSRGVVSR